MELKLAITGFGNVGQGLAALLVERADEYEQKYGVRLLLTGVADRGGGVTAASGLDPTFLLLAKRESGTVAGHPDGKRDVAGDAFLDAARADVLIEAASTNFQDAEPGWSYVRGALDRNMDVIFASKGCLALHWEELFGRAQRAHCSVSYSATVGAPVPALQMAERVLIGSTINGFEGILNGTTHQILTAMGEGASYEEGVRQAQEMGIAETDPTLDVDGWDAAAKVLIVANSVFGTSFKLQDVQREGIRGVTIADIEEARSTGNAIKLIARARREDGGIRLSVGPESRSRDDALGRLSGDAMGIVFATEPLGTMAATYEPGGYSGGVVTAMTCIRDILNFAHDRESNRR